MLATPSSPTALACVVAIGLLLVPGQVAGQISERLTGDAQQVLDRVRPILSRVVDTRGLEADREIPAGLHTRDSLRDVVIAQIEAEMSDEDFRREGAVYQRLGVLPPGTDYRELILGLLTSQIAGFYDDETGELFLIDDVPFATLEPTLAHELFHGIQDQRFGIARIRPDLERADDVLLGATALIEGDAVAVMVEYTIGGAISFTDIPNFVELAEDQLGSFDDAANGLPEEVPRFVIESLLFPYIDGLTFVHFLKSAGGWPAVNQAYLDPPRSSEQILHPERYVDRDEPTWVELDLGTTPAVAGFTPLYDQLFGEHQIRALFRQILADTVAERAILNAANGWDGDRLLAFERDDEVALVWLTVWDSTRDAAEFESLMIRYASERAGSPLASVALGENGSRHVLPAADNPRGGDTIVERWGDMVLYLDGVPSEAGAEDEESWRMAAWRGRQRAVYDLDALIVP